jgi:hypothetical protein
MRTFLLLILMLIGMVPAAAQKDDPLIRAVVGVATPVQIADIKRRLALLDPAPSRELPVTTGRDLGGATALESREIADNPSFARAYNGNPAATLFLLRYINQVLDQSRSRQ